MKVNKGLQQFTSLNRFLNATGQEQHIVVLQSSQLFNTLEAKHLAAREDESRQKRESSGNYGTITHHNIVNWLYSLSEFCVLLLEILSEPNRYHNIK
jgi:hypothetical protein